MWSLITREVGQQLEMKSTIFHLFQPTLGGAIAPPMGEIGACQSIDWKRAESEHVSF
jgi:hypothetical protein